MPIPHRLVAAALIGTSGTFVMLAMLWPHWRGDWTLLPAAAIGAALAGFLTANLFGQPGQRGLHWFFLGAFSATAFGAALAGLGFGLVIANTPAGLLYGPLIVFGSIFLAPTTLLVWLGTMCVSHVILRDIRALSALPS